MKRLPITMERITLSGCVVLALAFTLKADTFIVDLSPPEHTLYTDSNTGLQVKRGGFSGLHPVPGDRTGTLFYAVSDRGPGGDFGDGKFFVVPDLSPSIMTVALGEGGTADIVDVLPLRKPNGDPVTGIPNPCVPHESPLVDLNQVDISGLRDSDSLDPEGIWVDRAGNFWLCEEFRPSICMVAPDGTVMLRFVPEGTLCGDETIPTFDVVPAIFAKRITNRGFEDIALTRNGLLYTIMQSPLANPGRSQRDSSRNLRILRVDLRELLSGNHGTAMRQYLYITEPAPEGLRQRDVTVSSLFSLTPSLFVSAERGTNKVFAFNIAQATDVSGLESADGTLVSDPTRTVEQLSPEELAALGVRTVEKGEVISSTTDLDPFLGKAEGISVVGRTIYLTADNDFNIDEGAMDFSTFPATLGLQDPPNIPRIVTARLGALHLGD